MRCRKDYPDHRDVTTLEEYVTEVGHYNDGVACEVVCNFIQTAYLQNMKCTRARQGPTRATDCRTFWADQTPSGHDFSSLRVRPCQR